MDRHKQIGLNKRGENIYEKEEGRKEERKEEENSQVISIFFDI